MNLIKKAGGDWLIILLASETLTGVTQSKIGDVYLFIYVWTYVRHFCTLTLGFLC